MVSSILKYNDLNYFKLLKNRPECSELNSPVGIIEETAEPKLAYTRPWGAEARLSIQHDAVVSIQ